MNDYFWQTNRIRLRQVEPEDWEIHFLWNMDSEGYRNVWQIPFPQSKASVKAWAEKASTTEPEKDNFSLQIELPESGQLVGNLGSHHCDPRVGEFHYGIAIRREHRRMGYAGEAITLLMRYFFEELRYQKCTIDVYSWNEASIHLHEKLGFIREGQIRRCLFTQGQYFDRYVYGMTIEEFRERYG